MCRPDCWNMFLPIDKKINAIVEKATAGWRNLCATSVLLRQTDILLRSYGQLLFADNAATGFFLLIALMLISGNTVLFSVIGIVVASAAAYFFKEESILIRHGIFGFNGAIFGFFWSWYFPLSGLSVLLFMLMTIIVVLVQSSLMKKMSLGFFNLPVMSLPAVMILIASLVIVYWLVFSAGILPSFAVYPFNSEPLIIIQTSVSFLQSLLAWLLIFIGILINSRISAFAAILGAVAGYMIVYFFPAASMGHSAGIFVGFNAIPVAVSLFGIFLVANIQTFFFTFAGIAVCTIFWLLLAKICGMLNFPLLTLPFNFTVLAVLSVLRKYGTHANRLGLYLVPLDIITTPEDIILWQKRNTLSRTSGNMGKNIIRLLQQPGHLFGPSREEVAEFLNILTGAARISILSGAGTSTESGIPDFRSNYNYWKQFSAEDFTYYNFIYRPDIRARYWVMERRFYKIIRHARINFVHKAARWLVDRGRLSCVVTQNVDGLFQQAGVNSSKVIELHGTAHQVKCLNCGTAQSREDIDAMFNAGIYVPYCSRCFGLLKPATVLMGEELDKTLLEKALSHILASDLLVIMGTSLQVEPVASIPDIAWRHGVRIVIINSTATPKDHLAEMVVNCSAGKFCKKILQQMND